jgi:hypothetical protein
MTRPSNDDVPSTLSTDAAFIVAEILEEYAPATPEEYERLAIETEAKPQSFDGEPALAATVAAELRRRGQAARDAG